MIDRGNDVHLIQSVIIKQIKNHILINITSNIIDGYLLSTFLIYYNKRCDTNLIIFTI